VGGAVRVAGRPLNPRFKDAHAGTKRSLKAKKINRDSWISGTGSGCFRCLRQVLLGNRCYYKAVERNVPQSKRVVHVCGRLLVRVHVGIKSHDNTAMRCVAFGWSIDDAFVFVKSLQAVYLNTRMR
jgi:hypothetical protein